MIVLKLLLLLIYFQSAFGNESQITIPDSGALQQTDGYPFEPYVWIYWDEPIQNAPMFARLSYERLKITCQTDNLTLVLLSQQNLHLYIDNYEENYASIVKKAKVNYRPTQSDLIRLTVLQQKGGIWIDIGCVGIEYAKSTNSDLTLKGWIMRVINEQKYLASNAYVDDPDIILFYTSFFMNHAEYWNSEKQTNTNEYPGFETWFIVAKKGGQMITDLQRTFVQFYTHGFEYTTQKLSTEGIYQRNQDQMGYLTINLASSYVIQKKQRELDRQIRVANLFKSRNTVFEEYKVWGLHCAYGPLVIPSHLNSFDSLFSKTKEQIEEENSITIRFFIKFSGYARYLTVNAIEGMKQHYSSKFKNFAAFLESKPPKQTCEKVKFIVQGSLISYLLIENSLAKQQNVPILTVSQRNLWRQYCSSISDEQKSFVNFQQIGSKIAHIVADGRLDKIEYIERYQKFSQDEGVPIDQEIFIFFRANITRAFFFVALWVAIVLLTVTTAIFVISITVFSLFCLPLEKQKRSTQQRTESSQLQSSVDMQNHSTFEIESSVQIDQRESRVRKYLLFMAYYTTFIILVNYFLNVIFQGAVNQSFLTLAVTILTFYFNNFCSRNLEEREINSISQQKYLGLTFNQVDSVLRIFKNYYLCSIILFLFEKRQQFLVFHAIVVGVICPIMLSIIKQQDQTKNQHSASENLISRVNKAVKWVSKNYQKITVFCIILLIICPNLTYIVWEAQPHDQSRQSYDMYWTTYAPLIALCYVGLVGILAGRILLRKLIGKIAKLKQTHNQKKLPIVLQILRTSLTIGILIMMFVGAWSIRYHITRIVAPFNKIFYEMILCGMFMTFWQDIKLLSSQKDEKFEPQQIETKQSSVCLGIKLISCYLVPFIYTVFGSYQNLEANVTLMASQEKVSTHHIDYMGYEIPICFFFSWIPFLVLRRHQQAKASLSTEKKKNSKYKELQEDKLSAVESLRGTGNAASSTQITQE